MIKKRRTNHHTKVYAIAQYIFMSAHKARRVIDQIRGRSYAETLIILELMLYQACYTILKLVYSATANANHNMCFNKARLIISKAKVNGGKTVKKLKPRAQGRGHLIKRPMMRTSVAQARARGLRHIQIQFKFPLVRLRELVRRSSKKCLLG